VFRSRSSKSRRTLVAGWNALDNQYRGPVGMLQQKAYSSWEASWCAYTSSVALAPLGGVDVSS
jgi:hypothetical protein